MVLKAIKEMKKPFNVKKFYRRTFLVIYDVISVILASYLALMIRYGIAESDLCVHHFLRITGGWITVFPFLRKTGRT